MQDSATKPTTAFVDLGYRRKVKRIDDEERQRLKTRQAMKPIIGHMRNDNRLNRHHLKGETGERLHGMLCAASDKVRWLLRMTTKKEVTFLVAPSCDCAGLLSCVRAWVE